MNIKHLPCSSFLCSNLHVINADGLPAAVFYDDSSDARPIRKSSLGGISDEAIDCFPPTDEDLAELEAMDQYIEMLCYLEAVEQKEEDKRTFRNHRKRFEARRQEGLVGKPRSVSPSRVAATAHRSRYQGSELEKFHLWASRRDNNRDPVPAPSSPAKNVRKGNVNKDARRKHQIMQPRR